MKPAMLCLFLMIATAMLLSTHDAHGASLLSVAQAPGTTIDGHGFSIAMCPKPGQVVSAGGYRVVAGSGSPQSNLPYIAAQGRWVGWIVTDKTQSSFIAFIQCVDEPMGRDAVHP
jgi:hypothetical protein